MADYTLEEQMVCRIAAEVDESGVTVLGSFTPLAYAAYMLAKLTHAPRAYVIGYNAVGIRPVQLRFGSAESACYDSAIARWSFIRTINTVHLGARGLVECVSPAQIDGSGAINLSVIGDYQRPKVRLPGGAGAPEVIQYYRRFVVYFGRHDRRVLVDRVDFATGRRVPLSSPTVASHLTPPGPITVVTPLAVLVKDRDDQPFRLASLNRGATVADVVERSGFEVDVSGSIPDTPEPTGHQLGLLRESIDPFRTVTFDVLAGEERRQYLERILIQEWVEAEHAMERGG